MPPKKKRTRRLAVALRYRAPADNAPKVIAKGSDQLAAQIVRLAKEKGIPIREDKNLVQILSLLDMNQEVPPMVYAAVAEILAFVHRLGKAKPPPQAK